MIDDRPFNETSRKYYRLSIDSHKSARSIYSLTSPPPFFLFSFLFLLHAWKEKNVKNLWVFTQTLTDSFTHPEAFVSWAWSHREDDLELVNLTFLNAIAFGLVNDDRFTILLSAIRKIFQFQRFARVIAQNQFRNYLVIRALDYLQYVRTAISQGGDSRFFLQQIRYQFVFLASILGNGEYQIDFVILK